MIMLYYVIIPILYSSDYIQYIICTRSGRTTLYHRITDGVESE